MSDLDESLRRKAAQLADLAAQPDPSLSKPYAETGTLPEPEPPPRPVHPDRLKWEAEQEERWGDPEAAMRAKNAWLAALAREQNETKETPKGGGE